MSTTDQRAANAANARKSTGPKTPEGKQRVRLNAQKHGYTGQIWIVPEHLREAFEGFTKLNLQSLQPKDAAQQLAASHIIETRFRLRDIAAAQVSMLSLETQRLDRTEIFDAGDDLINAAIDTTLAYENQLPTLDKLGRYENRLNRVLRQAEAEYRDLQAARERRFEMELKGAMRAYNYCKRKGIAFDPEQFGFVCTVAEIEALVQREQLWDDIRADEKAIADAKKDPDKDPKDPIRSSALDYAERFQRNQRF